MTLARYLTISWSTLKIAKARDGFALFYVDRKAAGHGYDVFGTNQVQFFTSHVVATVDITDFETNFKLAATSVDSRDDFLALIPPAVDSSGRLRVVLSDALGFGITSIARPGGSRMLSVSMRDWLAPPEDHVLVTREITTTVMNIEAVIVTFTVPAGKNFFIASFSLNRVTINNVGAAPFAVKKNGTALTRRGITGVGVLNVLFDQMFTFPIKIATAGDVLDFTVTPDLNQPTVWSGILSGFVRSIS